MQTTTAKIPVTKRIHRDTFPETDHGYTWVECVWYEDKNGRRVSPIVPCAGCCARLLHLPGDPIPMPNWDFEERNFDVQRLVNSEDIHDGFHYVGPCCITRIPPR